MQIEKDYSEYSTEILLAAEEALSKVIEKADGDTRDACETYRATYMELARRGEAHLIQSN